MFKTKLEQKMELVEDIKELKKRGATYQEIANKFNAEDVTTVYGNQWSYQSLHRFYKKYSK